MERSADHTTNSTPSSPVRRGLVERISECWLGIEARVGQRTWLVVWAAYAVSIAIMATSRQKPGPDFEVFHRAAQRLLQQESLYQLTDGHWAYKYAPAVSFFFVPFAKLGLRAAWTLFNLLSALALVQLMRWGAARVGGRTRLLTHALIFLAVNPYASNLFRLGQIDAVLIWMVVASEELAERHPWLSGLLWATACLFKPPFLIFLPAALIFRQWRRLSGLALGATAWLAAGAIPFGVNGNLEQLHAWRETLASTTPKLICNLQNQSAWAIACSYGATPESGLPFWLALALLAALVAVPAAWTFLRTYPLDPRRARVLATAAAFYLSGFLSPLGWRTNLLGAIPIFYLLLDLHRTAPSTTLRRATIAAMAAGVAGELLDRVGGWIAGQPRTHEFVLESRYYGLTVFATVVLALGVAAARSRQLGGLCSGSERHL